MEEVVVFESLGLVLFHESNVRICFFDVRSEGLKLSLLAIDDAQEVGDPCGEAVSLSLDLIVVVQADLVALMLLLEALVLLLQFGSCGLCLIESCLSTCENYLLLGETSVKVVQSLALQMDSRLLLDEFVLNRRDLS